MGKAAKHAWFTRRASNANLEHFEAWQRNVRKSMAERAAECRADATGESVTNPPADKHGISVPQSLGAPAAAPPAPATVAATTATAAADSWRRQQQTRATSVPFVSLDQRFAQRRESCSRYTAAPANREPLAPLCRELENLVQALERGQVIPATTASGRLVKNLEVRQQGAC